ncbi:hypothetical protein AcdelDRAFT_0287 [Acidovorax delafieldii 2AN]|uniref:Uncharacterized protein n=1 Tax=Acidovorax delafieldii 2AN TaxID=573060 RepID=C5T057_ACIDE|nr:hypothetical protein [Acidovorax delafieldii]EER62165.1 hypothetical protein AcdelDRAFT_0287 [Acidovorax delafieldii 2AN]
MSMKQWNVRVMRSGSATHIGQVAEINETLARCAALSRYGVSEDEAEEFAQGCVGPCRAAIYPDEEFDVSPAK